jgi:4-hydroxyphenylpyruvate dioxygenase
MRRSIASICLSGSLDEKLVAASAAHFEAVEIYEADLIHFDGTPADVRSIANGLGLAIDVYQPFKDFEGAPDDLFQRALERAERKFDVMEQLGAPMMVVLSNTAKWAINDDARAASQLAALADRAALRGMRIAYEPASWASHINSLEHGWKVVKAAAHSHLGLVLDSFQVLAPREDLAVIDTIPGDRIFHVQVADAPHMSIDLETWSRRYRCFPGQGDLDVAGFVARALAAGYVGGLSLEIFNDEIRSISPRLTAFDGFRSLQFLEERARGGVLGPRREHDPKARNAALFDPPPPARLSGVSFIEFAVSEEGEKTLGEWLVRFGFERVGAHRSKAVTLYRGGGVNLVLNAQPDSFARSYYLVHGTSICAVGLRTPEPLLAMGRATAFHAQRFNARAGPNELDIPAIRALDGSLIYFVDETLESGGLYEIEFEIEKEMPRPVLGDPESVDHIAMALPPGLLDSWVLFYRAVLGFEGRETLTLPDPFGLVRSRAMADVARTVRVPLNVALGQQTATARAVLDHSGAGVHHIAFSCENIFDAVDRLKAAGAPLLPIPGNYYDDLRARTDLSEAFIDRLRAGNILYDSSPDGEFFHVYSEMFQTHFFVEYVQRVWEYNDYGAVNAPVRMAAQSRRLSEADEAQLL